MRISFTAVLTLVLLFLTIQISAQETRSGFEFYAAGEYRKAADALQKTIDADEQNRTARLYLGMSYAKLKEKKKAVKAFEQADKLTSKETAAPIDKEIPFQITVKPRVRYTDDARTNQIQGTIKMAVEFLENGEVGEIFPFKQLPFGLTESSVEAARKISFTPAQKDGKPVSTIEIISYSFSIY